MKEKPNCFGFWKPNEEECEKNCDLVDECRLYQEKNIFPELYEKYKLQQEAPNGLTLDDLI